MFFSIYIFLPNKHTNLEDIFDGFMITSVLRFEFEMSPLHIIVYGATGTGKTFLDNI